MYQSKRFRKCWNKFCVGLLLLSLLLRLLSSAAALRALRRGLQSGTLAELLTSAAFGRRVSLAWEAPQTGADAAQLDVPEPTPSQTAALETDEPPASAAAEPPVFTDADAASLSLRSSIQTAVDLSALLLQPLTLRESADGPKVLIVHTHSCEAYLPDEAAPYEESSSRRTLDKSQNVIRVGDELQAVLEECGIPTLHDVGYNDYPNYSGGYDRMRETISDYLAQYPSICVVIDLHRDAVSDGNGGYVGDSVAIDGVLYAPLMFVVGTDEGGLSHPNWRENLSLAAKLQALLNREYPVLCRSISLRRERFNADLCSGALLLEIGSTENTLEQALATARVFGRTLAALLLST